MVLLRTVYWQILWGTQKGISVKTTFGNLYFFTNVQGQKHENTILVFLLQGLVYPKVKIMSLITHPHVVSNTLDLRSSLEHKLRYLMKLRAFWPSNVTDMIKTQKGSKDIIKIVHVTSVVQP